MGLFSSLIGKGWERRKISQLFLYHSEYWDIPFFITETKIFLLCIDHVHNSSCQTERDLALTDQSIVLRSLPQSSFTEGSWILTRDKGHWLTHLKTLLSLHLTKY